MPATTFTITGQLLDFGGNPRVGVEVTAGPSPKVKVGHGASFGPEPEQTVTDEDGNFTLTLISLVGLWYRISAKGVHSVRLAAYTPDPLDTTTGTEFASGVELDFDDLVDEQPTPGYEGVFIGGVASVNGEVGVVVLDAADVGAASTAALTAEQDARIAADSALLTAVGAETTARTSADTLLDGRIDALEAAGGAVASVNGQTGAVILDAADVGAATTAQGTKADTAVQPGDLTAYATDAELASGLAGKADSLTADENYVTDAEKAALHTHPAFIGQGATAALARAAIGAGTSSFSGDYDDLTDQPTLGTAAAADAGDFATAAEGALAGTALQPGDVTHVPDPSAQPDDKILVTAGGALVYADVPAGGGGSDPGIYRGEWDPGLGDYAQTAIDLGANALFMFESGTDTADSSGLGHDLTHYNGGPSFSASMLANSEGRKATYNGSNQYSAIASASWMNTPSFAVSARITVSGGTDYVAGRWVNTGSYAWLLLVVSGRAQLLVNIAGVNRQLDGTTLSIPVGDHTIGGSFDGTTMRLFVDGVPDGSAAYAGSMPSVSAPFEIARAAAAAYSTTQVSALATFPDDIAPADFLELHNQAIGVVTGGDPYMTGEMVYHDGRFWTSAVDNNVSEPGTNADWEPLPLTYAGLSDVDMTGLADGDIPVWNATDSEWQPSALVGTALQPADIALHIDGDGSILHAVAMPQAAYDALVTPDPDTLYVTF